MAAWLWAVLLGAALLAVLVLAALWLTRTQDAETRELVRRVGALPWRTKLRLVWSLLREGRVPLWLRAVIPALIVYLVLPIDLIPDFIPVVGHLDDLLIVILAIGTLIRFTPRLVLDDLLARLEGGGAER